MVFLYLKGHNSAAMKGMKPKIKRNRYLMVIQVYTKFQFEAQNNGFSLFKGAEFSNYERYEADIERNRDLNGDIGEDNIHPHYHVRV